MTYALTSPVTGAAQTGLTSPTYTVTADTAPDVNAKQWAITALGGTQTGVTVHSVAAPFTHTAWKPKVMGALGKTNPVTGLLPSVPRNIYKLITRKGVIPLAGQPFVNAIFTTTSDVPAGSDTADPANLRAALSLHFGASSQQSAGWGDTLVNGIL